MDFFVDDGQSDYFSCLVLGYRRLNLVLPNLKILKAGGVGHIYLSVDGSLDPNVVAHQTMYLGLIAEESNKLDLDLTVLTRSMNHGLAASVITGIDWYFSHEEYGAILEEDEIPTQSFFTWVKMAELNFRGDDDVLMYSGHQFFPEENEKNKVSWVDYPVSAAFGTNRVKWQTMKRHIFENEKSFKNYRNILVSVYWTCAKYRALNGFTDSWAIPLAAGMRANSKYSVIPPINLCSNVGDEEYATNTRGNLPDYFKESFEVPNIQSWDYSLNNSLICNQQNLFESRVYQIRKRHILLPLKVIWEFIRFPKPGKKLSLAKRVSLARLDYKER